MALTRKSWRYGFAGVGVLLGAAAVTAATAPTVWVARVLRRPERPVFQTSPVRRADLNASMTTGGKIESIAPTVIESEIENVDVRVRGQSTSAGGSSTILTIVPDGSTVKKGDLLVRMDSSDFEEIVRVQTINLERSRSDLRQAELNLDIARLAIPEYRDGLMRSSLQTMQGKIALNEADQGRAAERLEWARKMFDKGYFSKSQVSTEESTLERLNLSLTRSKTSLNLFEKFYAPKYLHILNSNIAAAEATYNFQKRRTQWNEERLAHYTKLVANCTIVAPHDGFVIHANEDNKNVRIEEGMSVRPHQRLLYLPDMGRLRVDAMLHESVVRNAKPGMDALVRVEGGNKVLTGKLSAVAQLPTLHWFSDVRFYVGTVLLDKPPEGLKPGMSAEVEIVTARKPEALVVPYGAVALEGGDQVCYVSRGEALERRKVTLGDSARDLCEVTDGLDEGDQVVMDPENVAHLADAVQNPEPAEPASAVPSDD